MTSIIGELNEAIEKALDHNQRRHFFSAVTGYMRENRQGLDAALDTFRQHVRTINDADPEITDEIAAEIMAKFEEEAGLFRLSIQRARDLVALADLHPQYPFEDAQRRDPATGTGADQ